MAQVPLTYVDNTEMSTVDDFMRDEVVGARQVMICVGYVSQAGLARLLDWLDLMAPDGELLLLVGMAPRNWKFLAQSADAHATYLLRSMQIKAVELDRALLRRLAGFQSVGRLQLRLREPRHQMHAKLYLIESGPEAWKGLAGSSNLSQSGLTQQGEFNLVLNAATAAEAGRWLARQWEAPSSQPADDVWRALFNKAAPAQPDRTHRSVPKQATAARTTRKAAVANGAHAQSSAARQPAGSEPSSKPARHERSGFNGWGCWGWVLLALGSVLFLRFLFGL